MKKTYQVIGVLATIPLSVLFGGLATRDLWEWFIIPVFESAPVLSLGSAIGIRFVFGFLCKSGYQKKDRDTENDSYTATILTVLAPLMVWGIGYILHIIIAV